MKRKNMFFVILSKKTNQSRVAQRLEYLQKKSRSEKFRAFREFRERKKLTSLPHKTAPQSTHSAQYD